MTAPADLSKLRINHDAPSAPEKKALTCNLVLVVVAMNTMYAAVSSRTPEIAVLLTLGFHPRSVLASFLAESAIIAFIGGVIGCLLAPPINGVVTSTTNWASFSEIAFAFRVTPRLLLAGLGFAAVMGVVGGFFRRAAHQGFRSLRRYGNFGTRESREGAESSWRGSDVVNPTTGLIAQ